MAKVKAPTKYEIDFALKFLTAAGVKKAHTKAYLIAAVVAWKRASKTDSKVWGSPWSALAKLKKTVGGDKVLKTLRQYVAAAKYEQQQQAVRFLTMLGMSGWDKEHFGFHSLPPNPDGTINIDKYELVVLWDKLLNTKWSIPQPQPPQPKPQLPPKPPKPKPRQPDDKVYLTPVPVYLQPYAAFSFYEERKRPLGVPGELVK